MVLHGRVVRKLEALYDEIVAAGHPEPIILPLDLAKATADDFGNVASALQAQLGRLDGLVHTAALLGSLGPIEHQSFDSWLSLLRVNVAAPMGLTRAVMPLLAAVARRERRVHARQPRRAAARVLGRLRRDQGRRGDARARARGRMGEPRRTCASTPSCPGPIHSPLRGQTHPGEDRASLPSPDALAPLYLHLIAGQTKADSGDARRRSGLARRAPPAPGALRA